MPNDLQPLRDAADRNSSCILNFPAAGVSYTRRSRLLGHDESGFWAEFDPADELLLNDLIRSARPVLTSLRDGQTDLLFNAPVLRLDPALALNGSHAVPAILIATPAKLTPTKRRANFRVPVSPDDGIAVKLYRINEYVLVRERPQPSLEMRCDLLNLSLGGMQVVIHAKGAEAMKLVENQRFRIELRIDKNDFILEGRLRYPTATNRDDASATCGISFQAMDRDHESRRASDILARTLAHLQRNIARRRVAA